MKLSPIFPPEVKPTRVGLWKTSNYGRGYVEDKTIWDGTVWRWPEDWQACLNQNRYWQGLAEELK